MVQTDRAKGRYTLFRGISIIKTSRLIFDCHNDFRFDTFLQRNLFTVGGSARSDVGFVGAEQNCVWIVGLIVAFAFFETIFCLFWETFPGWRWCHMNISHEGLNLGCRVQLYCHLLCNNSSLPPMKKDHFTFSFQTPNSHSLPSSQFLTKKNIFPTKLDVSFRPWRKQSPARRPTSKYVDTIYRTYDCRTTWELNGHQPTLCATPT